MEKNFTGAVPRALASGNYVVVSSNRKRVDEIWANLEYISQIDDSREKFLTQLGITGKLERTKVGNALKSYITQAKNFYSYAEKSDYRSAALLYYYSYLNLAKAKLVISNPGLAGKEFHHGMKLPTKKGGIKKLTTAAKTTRGVNYVSVFNEIYKLRFGRSLNTAYSISLDNLLAYSTDISAEYQEVMNGVSKISPVKYSVCFDTNRRKAWIKLAVYDWQRHQQFVGAFKNFIDEFYPVSLFPLTRDSQFGTPMRASMGYTFFESKSEFDFIGYDNIDVFSCDTLLRNVLENAHQANLYDPEAGGFELISPLRKNLQLPMDEMTAGYMAMYHLSEIVRYRPEQMEKLLSEKTRDGWLLKNYIEQAPQTVLYRMSCWITGKNIAVMPR